MTSIHRLPLLFLAAALVIPAAQAATIFTVTPSTISAAPGSTVGWGFTIFNDSNYLVVTSADFTPASPLGTFTDYIAQFNFIVVGPSPEATSVSQTFDMNALTGVGSYAIAQAAPPGSNITGQIVLSYDLFSRSPNDPNFNPDTDTVSVGNSLFADAQVNVISGVPEPASFGLVAVALLIGGMTLSGRKRCFGLEIRCSERKKTSNV